MGQKSPADSADEIGTTFCIAAVDNSSPELIINTQCLKEGCFVESNACAIVEQLAPAFMRTTGAGDEAPDASAMVEGLAGIVMSNAGARIMARGGHSLLY